MGVARILVEMDSREYNMYFRTIRQREQAPDQKCSRGQALFRSWISGGCALWVWLVLLLKWTLKNVICILDPLDRGYKSPVKSTLESRHFSAVAF